ncbi:NADP-dependent oxidoreductase [Luteimicrobium sp. NPDC057192]|uniref:NADP-dependent oxidoreductase n=1 Tax=Luteimicrobium sp. NPDC057192 TaxID=3346042 RepID=UPI00364073FB
MTHAISLTDFGGPEVLRPADVVVPGPGRGQIRVALRLAGVGPTDLALRSGRLKAFGAAKGTVLGFEGAGTVESVGSGVDDVAPGDDVAVFLPGLGGYAELVIAEFWVRKPATVSWEDAAALPASGEAAVRVLDLVSVGDGDTLLVLGAAGSVGTVVTQLAVARGATVIAAVRPADFAAVQSLGAVPVSYSADLVADVRSRAGRVDAVVDAATRSDLQAAIDLAGGPERVVTLSNANAAALGVRLSGPEPGGVVHALSEAMSRLADRGLVLRSHTVIPLSAAAEAHTRLEAGERSKFLLAP